MSEQLKEVQAERGNVYGGFNNHSAAVDQIMEILRNVNREKNNNTISTNWPEGFETAAFYMVTKLVRLATTPHHVDSALDLSSYADLWLKIIEPDKNEVCYAEPEPAEECCDEVCYAEPEPVEECCDYEDAPDETDN